MKWSDECAVKVARDGWATASDLALEKLMTFALTFGTPVPAKRGGPLVEELIVRSSQDLGYRSLSTRYGKGSFPLHTDGAFLPNPPRYLFLRLKEGSRLPRATTLMDASRLSLSEDDIHLLKRALFGIRGGGRPFLAPIATATEPGGIAYRYDINCMAPRTRAAEKAFSSMEAAIDRQEPERIEWEVGMVLVIDNHRLLHGRASSGCEDEVRVLQRISIAERRDV